MCELGECVVGVLWDDPYFEGQEVPDIVISSWIYGYDDGLCMDI